MKHKQPDESYFDPSAPLDERLRYPHEECDNTRDALIITRVARGWTYRCYKCGLYGFKPFRGRSPSQLREYINAWQIVQADSTTLISKEPIKLPNDYTTTIPDIGVAWLTRYGITDDEVALYKFGYSRRMHRLILPVYLDGVLVYWQGRNLGEITDKNPKYLNVKVPTVEGFRVYNSSQCLVIVEDILSAVKVARAGADTWALLGSYISDRMIQPCQTYRDVVIWLDPDKRKDMLRFKKRLSFHGVNVRVVMFADLDPKDYDVEKIKEYLSE